jgi:site-specific DNA-cytosine methylase
VGTNSGPGQHNNDTLVKHNLNNNLEDACDGSDCSITDNRIADRPPLTRRTPRLYQRAAYRRRNTQHSRIYDEFGLAPTVSTTSAVYVWHDGTQARLLQARELARLQGLPGSFVLPEGRVVATRLIGNAVPPALIRALLL